MSERERAMGLGMCVEFGEDGRSVAMAQSVEQEAGLRFTYDAVFPPSASQATVYEESARPIVESVLEGFNGTVFAYGQTGSGKTFTMTGPNVDHQELKGIIPRMINTVFEKISTATEDLEFSVKVGYSEIYMEKIKDLLEPANSNLKIHEDKTRGVYIAGLSEEYVSTESEVYSLMKLGSSNREVGATLMNEGSSRFFMTITQNNVKDYSAKTGKLYLVDLAGSEKVGKTGAEGKRLDEAKTINKSLSSLGQVINALTDGKSAHIPYRDSKLTRVLQDSLGGNSKTALIVTCSPSLYNESETLSTLRFGLRAKSIKNKPKVNREFTVSELKLLLAKAEAGLEKKQATIEALSRKVVELGGELVTEKDIIQPEEGNGKTVITPEMEEMTAEMETLRDKLEEERKAAGELTRQVLALTAAHSQVGKEVEMHRLEAADLKLKSAGLKDALIDKEEEVARLDHVISGLQETISTLQQRISTLESDNQSLNSSLASQPNIDEVLSLTSRMSGFKLKEELEIKEIQAKELRARLELQEAVIRRIETSTGNAGTLRLIQQYRSTDLEAIVSTQELLMQERERSAALAKEVEQAREQVHVVMASKVPNYEEIRRRIASEAVGREKLKWESERKIIIRDLQNRIDKAVSLEIDLDELQEAYRQLLKNTATADPRLKGQLEEVKRENERINAVNQTVMREKGELAAMVDTLRRKMERVEERLKATEVQLGKAMQEVVEKNTQVEALEKANEEVANRQSIRTLNLSHHIQKRIKGGRTSLDRLSHFAQARPSQTPFEVREETDSSEPQVTT
jgi:kinesin family protein 5